MGYFLFIVEVNGMILCKLLILRTSLLILNPGRASDEGPVDFL